VIALQEARKLLKTPGGKLLLLEHNEGSLLGTVLNPTRNIGSVIGTCRYHDDVVGLLKAAGFQNIVCKSVAGGGFLVEVVAS